MASGSESLNRSLLEIYRRLRFHQGLQSWWPGESSFEVVIGCILTQNTNWRNVEKAIANLKSRDLLSPARLLALPVDELAELIKPTGFYSQKPYRLQTISRWWLEKFGNEIYPLQLVEETRWGDTSGQLRIPAQFATRYESNALRKELLALNGVGAETADAILLYALGHASFVIDAYTVRIFSRLGLVEENPGYEKLRELFQSSLRPDIALFDDYHAQLVALAKINCRKTPVCFGCPLGNICSYCNSSLRRKPESFK